MFRNGDFFFVVFDFISIFHFIFVFVFSLVDVADGIFLLFVISPINSNQWQGFGRSITGRRTDYPPLGTWISWNRWRASTPFQPGKSLSLPFSLSLSLALCEHLPPTWLQLSIKPNGSAPILQNPVGTQSTTPRAAEIKIWLFRWNVCDSISIDPLFKAVGIQSRMNFWLIKTRIDAGTILPAITWASFGMQAPCHVSAQLRTALRLDALGLDSFFRTLPPIDL